MWQYMKKIYKSYLKTTNRVSQVWALHVSSWGCKVCAVAEPVQWTHHSYTGEEEEEEEHLCLSAQVGCRSQVKLVLRLYVHKAFTNSLAVLS